MNSRRDSWRTNCLLSSAFFDVFHLTSVPPMSTYSLPPPYPPRATTCAHAPDRCVYANALQLVPTQRGFQALLLRNLNPRGAFQIDTYIWYEDLLLVGALNDEPFKSPLISSWNFVLCKYKMNAPTARFKSGKSCAVISLCLRSKEEICSY